MTENRTPLTVRLAPADKQALADAAAVAGLEVGIAARQILEMFVRRLRATPAPDYIEALADLNADLKNREVVV